MKVGSESGKKISSDDLVQTSKTFPGLCRASVETAICHLETVAVVQTRDCQGNAQDCGGDPVTAEVLSHRGSTLDTNVTGQQLELKYFLLFYNISTIDLQIF